MAVTFPTSLDTSTFPIAATLTAETLAVGPHSKLHDELGQAILHLETKVGIDSSGDTNSLDYKINHIVAVPVGVIFPFGGSSPPTNYLICNGALVSTTTYAALYAILGTTFGTGSGTFGVPDLRGRVVAGLDNMGGSAASRIAAATSLGQAAGEETHTLVTGELASHTHIQNAHNHTDAGHAHNVQGQDFLITAGGVGLKGLVTTAHNDNESTDNGSASINNNTATNQNAGSGTAHNNLQPYLALNYIIRY